MRLEAVMWILTGSEINCGRFSDVLHFLRVILVWRERSVHLQL